MDGRLRIGVFVVLFLASAAAALAQGQGNGTFTGTIADSDGVVPGATITATDPTTGLVRTATSNEQGIFRLLSLPPGRYALRVEMEGFKHITLNDVLLLSGEARELGKLMLEVGVLSEAVTVTAEVTPVQTTASQLQRTVTGDRATGNTSPETGKYTATTNPRNVGLTLRMDF